MSRSSGPRIRTIKPEVWQDERLAGLGDLEHRLYIGLVTQADDEGRQSANLALLRARIFPFDPRPPEQLADALAALRLAGLVELYEIDGRALLQLRSWAEDQRVDRPTPSKLPPPSESTRDSSRGIANVPALARGRRPDLDLDLDLDQDLSSPNGDEPVKEGQVRPDVSALCHLLADLMRSNDEQAKVQPDSKAWRDPMRLLIDRDGRAPDVIERVIRWSQADQFWRTNVLSPGKLRAKFPQLALRMDNRPPPPGSAVDHGRFDKYDVAASGAAEDLCTMHGRARDENGVCVACHRPDVARAA